MKYLDGILYITYEEARKAGISSNTLKKAKHRGSSSWVFASDPDDGRRVLIQYEALKPKYRELIRQTFGDPYVYAAHETVTTHPMFRLRPEDAEFIDNYRLPDGKKLPEKHIETFKNHCRWLHLLSKTDKIFVRSLGFGSVLGFKRYIGKVIEQKGIKLPTSRTRLDALVRRYEQKGALAVVERYAWRFGNRNSAKIYGEVADWLLAQYALINKPSVQMVYMLYNQVREEKQWPELDQTTIYKWLYKPEQKRVWMLARDGYSEWKRQYGHYLKTDKNLFPNAHWVIDGTKLDMIHYWDNKTKMAAKLKIDPVFDVHSERILGYSISHTEDQTDHFRALKMAVQTAKARPYLLTYDHQSGHMTKSMQRLYDQIVAVGGTHYPHRVRNHGPAENLLNRLQQQVIGRWWFSDKQSPMSRRMQNKPNMEELTRKRTDADGRKWSYTDMLPELDEVIRAWEMTVEKWNNSPHSRYPGKTRNEVYAEQTGHTQPFTDEEIKRIFWLTTPKPRKYTAGGIQLTIGGQTFEYEVYTPDGRVDIDFRERYTGVELYRRYDPDNPQKVDLMLLTENGYQWVGTAELKRTHTPVPAMMGEGDKAAWHADFRTRDEELARAQNRYNEIAARTGITNDALIRHQNDVLKSGDADAELVIKSGGLAPKNLRAEAESWVEEL